MSYVLAEDIQKTLHDDLEDQQASSVAVSIRPKIQVKDSNAGFSATAYLLTQSDTLAPEMDEEIRLMKRYEDDPCDKTMHDLILLVVPMFKTAAKSIAKSFRAKDREDDLFQTGVAACLAGLPSFDMDRGTRFTTYARYTGVGAMMEFVIRQGDIITKHKSAIDRKVFWYFQRENKLHMERTGKPLDITPDLIERAAAHLDVSLKNVIRVHEARSYDFVSPTAIANTLSYCEAVTPAPSGSQRILAKAVSNVLRSLKRERDKTIYLTYFTRLADSDTAMKAEILRVLAAQFNITDMRVAQIINGINATLKRTLQAQGFTTVGDIL